MISIVDLPEIHIFYYPPFSQGMTSTKRALVCIAPGFEEVEFTVPVDILRRGGVDVKIATILGSFQFL